MAELIPTGVTFGDGRKSLNSFFSANTSSEITSKGLGLSALQVNGSMSANTIYSGSTEISELFPAMANISVTTETGTQGGFSYSLRRITLGGFKMFVEVDIPLLNSGTTITGMTIVPTNFEGRGFFKLNSMLVSYPEIYFTTAPGEFGQGTIDFNNLLNTGATKMTIDLRGGKPGTFVYMDDTISLSTFSTDANTTMEYITTTLPNLSIEPIEMGITGRTGFIGSGDTKIIIEGMLI